MSKVAVIGATGQIGQLITKILSINNNVSVTGFVRNVEKAMSIFDSSIRLQEFSFNSTVDEIERLFNGFDTVIFTAGASAFDKYEDIAMVDLDGAFKVIEASEVSNVKRFIIISSINAHNRDFWYNVDVIKVYYAAKRAVDKYLAKTDLDWTILEPVPLVDEEATGKLRESQDAYDFSLNRYDFANDYLGIKVTRQDVAQFAFDALQNDKTIKKTIPLINGEFSFDEFIEKL
ncbi:hypothetical protein WICANDRAFT_64183 [Wickerhamomyces anomalus NRRL Y-366-8]|uniref:NAD(P)-binding domain-containing protein n=1 Tax=Wickerhamomyces anomalus (strain ATCC 58044 / CBS 1984 / NCYC 433 / NRRL Y-366-8) TaxID=683960 RepID=A0A1E3NY60_WICAA|nr:uncharacterized protein WICANDRAFT_64183 [Wickerhamomyces anomalus NRRL Y-366-8]ODQ58035.1 hypothetical protein WICANDRAFT_64183 [Wickerhamomyces anomalus NRRL Y-366-8]